MSSSSPLTLDDIRSTLASKRLGRHLHLHHSLASTNSEAMMLAQNGAEDGTVVVAESQSAGRGRHARTWFSPPGLNLYCSIIVRGLGRGLSLADWLSWVPLTTALAVAEAVQETAATSLALKWPNDLLLDERKAGGILCESSLAIPDSPIVVIGIGLNVNVPRESFPDELRPIATSLFESSHRLVDRNRLLARLLLELEQSLDELRDHGSSRLLQAYQRRCTTLGRQVRVVLGTNEELLGTAVAITADGTLQVRPSTENSGTGKAPLIDIRAGDVIHVRN
ncbi:biotin--[acetyl-CoA-carboxylase] ligase [Nitrospira lenta]|uniref:biotin--[biotin carboxyl-carrier protein] ligase n=1 Tax=Nitrospira lenta TaxID=1436998 RepID=A0A330L8D6_9BACT|nr:biotin--[acetyl-CoA-carboxylase] ligase [Nitrospira lenta]SPP65511.1 putative Biotin-(Acetyl-CoA-carboxylase) ligase [Nitrospira lenta]